MASHRAGIIPWAEDRIGLSRGVCIVTNGAVSLGGCSFLPCTRVGHSSVVVVAESCSWQPILSLSCYPAKTFGAMGDAGIVVTTSKKYEESIRSMIDQGRPNYTEYPMNARMSVFQIIFHSLRAYE